MKILALLSILFLWNCKDPSEPKKLANKTTFDWLTGQWSRTNDQEGQNTYERWDKTNDSMYVGVGYMLKGTDTLSKENMLLVKNGEKWYFDVRLDGELDHVSFALTEMAESGFICENATNDFPKVINYQLKGDSLMARISGGADAIDFWFTRDIK